MIDQMWWSDKVHQNEKTFANPEREKRKMRIARLVTDPLVDFKVVEQRHDSKNVKPKGYFDPLLDIMKNLASVPCRDQTVETERHVPRGFDIIPRGNFCGISIRNDRMMLIEASQSQKI